MFDIGWSELVLIGVVALIVIGPKDLPDMFRQLGRFTAKLRSMARDFQRAMDQAANESGVKDVAKDLKTMTSSESLGINAMRDAAAKFEKWDPVRNAARPTAPVSAAVKAPAPLAASGPAAAPAVAEMPPAGPETQALIDRQAERQAILRETTERLRAVGKPAPRPAAATPAEPTITTAPPPAPKPRARKPKLVEAPVETAVDTPVAVDAADATPKPRRKPRKADPA